ncbi:MAG: hypothetical protein HQK65_15620, partial [Desulfamplus sp.]|nr:hypothetical protein [Desulfamplus sp.]
MDTSNQNDPFQIIKEDLKSDKPMLSLADRLKMSLQKEANGSLDEVKPEESYGKIEVKPEESYGKVTVKPEESYGKVTVKLHESY